MSALLRGDGYRLALEYRLCEIDDPPMGSEHLHRVGDLPPSKEDHSEFVDGGVELRLGGNSATEGGESRVVTGSSPDAGVDCPQRRLPLLKYLALGR